MTTIDLSGIEDISGSVYIEMSGARPYPSRATEPEIMRFFPKISQAHHIKRANSFPSINIADLKSVERFTFFNNTFLELNLTQLATINMLNISSNPTLSYLNLLGVHFINETLSITDNALLLNVSMKSLIHATEVHMRGGFTAVEFPNLR
jgi:hypothetical protein